MKKVKVLFRYTDQQKQELYEFVKVRLQKEVPFKTIFRLVKTDFPWYRAKSIIAFQLYWKYLKEEFLTYGTPNADVLQKRHEKQYKLKQYKLNKKTNSKTWSGVNKVKVLGQDSVKREASAELNKWGMRVEDPCSETNVGSLPIDHIVGIVSDLAAQVLDQLPVIMISALKTHHKDAAKFEKIKGLIAETAGNLDRLDDLIKNLKEFREVLG